MSLIAAGLLAGCATDPFRSLPPPLATSSAEIARTAFFPQDAYQCGPAALATLLDSAGVPVTPQQLVPLVYIPELNGSLQTEIIAASRAFGRIPYVIEPTFTALLAEIDAGRPVLVLQNLGVSFAAAWHYAVVIGYSGSRSEIFLRSGTTRRLSMAASTFASTWRRSNNWGIVLLQADEIPPSADSARYLQSVAAAESAGQFGLALAAYTAAYARWPDEPLASLGLGNINYLKGNYDAAELWYRRLLSLRPQDPVGMNNLASVMLASGRCDEAAGIIDGALTVQNAASGYRPLLETTAAELDDCRVRTEGISIAE